MSYVRTNTYDLPMTAIFNSHWADLYWSHWGRFSHATRTSNMNGQAASASCIHTPSLIPDPFRGFPPPMNVMVLDSKERRWTETCQTRLWANRIPNRGLVEIDNGFYVVSPEFLFLEMARKLDFAQTIAFGYELCGTYSIDALTGEATFDLPPATSSAKIRRFIDEAGSVHGIQMARKALCHICDNSASPMETCLHMHFQLPKRLGGFGLPHSILNMPVALNDKAKKLYPHDLCRCDIAFPAIHRAVEYCGKFHSFQWEDDISRSVALNAMGYNTTTVTFKHYDDLWALGEIARAIAKEHGSYLKRHHVAPTINRMKLHESLKRYYLGLDRKSEAWSDESVELAKSITSMDKLLTGYELDAFQALSTPRGNCLSDIHTSWLEN